MKKKFLFSDLKDDVFIQWLQSLPIGFIDYLYMAYEVNERDRIDHEVKPRFISPMSHNEKVAINQAWEHIQKKPS